MLFPPLASSMNVRQREIKAESNSNKFRLLDTHQVCVSLITHFHNQSEIIQKLNMNVSFSLFVFRELLSTIMRSSLYITDSVIYGFFFSSFFQFNWQSKPSLSSILFSASFHLFCRSSFFIQTWDFIFFSTSFFSFLLTSLELFIFTLYPIKVKHLHSQNNVTKMKPKKWFLPSLLNWARAFHTGDFECVSIWNFCCYSRDQISKMIYDVLSSSEI